MQLPLCCPVYAPNVTTLRNEVREQDSLADLGGIVQADSHGSYWCAFPPYGTLLRTR